MFFFATVYLLLRADERRLARPQLPGKSALVGSLKNFAAYGFLASAILMLLPAVAKYPQWKMFRIGLAIGVSSGVLLVGSSVLASRLFGGQPAEGLARARKYFSGSNLLLGSLTTLAIFGWLFYFVLEWLSRERMPREFFMEPLKVYLVVLASTGAFTAIQLLTFLESSDPRDIEIRRNRELDSVVN